MTLMMLMTLTMTLMVSQEDFEMAVGKVMAKDNEKNMSLKQLFK